MKINAVLWKQVTHLVWIFLSLSFFNVQAQVRVGQPSGAIDGSAALDISSGPYSSGSPYRGLLPPKVALTQVTQTAPITNPTIGLLVYNTASVGDVVPGYYYWDGSKWVRLITSGPENAVVGGMPLPQYTLTQARSLTAAPPTSYSSASPTLFMLVEEGKEGLFRYAPELTLSDPGHPEWYAPDDGVMVIITAGRSPRGDRMTYRRVYDSEINVRWFGAKGDGANDDSKAIQAAIDYARSKGKVDRQLPLFASGGGFYRTTVLIPEGNYRIDKTIDVTNTSGILIKGAGGRYINTSLIGCTVGAIFDFTGSGLSGCENLTLTSYLGYPNVSSIGVLFALGANGDAGLNCSIKNCYFQMADNPTANNGLGSIGILNCRAEEFAVTDCVIRANIGAIFSYRSSLADVGYNYTIQSAYTTLATGVGSMGVINFTGQNTIQNYGLAQPGLVLNGTNSLNFHGYISRISYTGSGTNEAAVLFGGPVTYNATINATVESFAQLMRVTSSLLNSTISCVVANQTNASSSFPVGTTRHPVIALSGGGQIHGCKISITFGNGSAEIDGRYLIYDGGVNAASLLNDEIICSQWTANNYVVSTNLLNKAENTSFKTAYPFEKRPLLLNAVINAQSFSTSGWTTSTYNQIVATGTLISGTVYIMKVIWGKPGVDQVIQSYVFPISITDFNTNPAAQVLPVLTPSTISFGNVGRTINIRYKAPAAVGQTTYGLEANISKSDMDNGTLTITVAPLL